jgi:hypothetical protein
LLPMLAWHDVHAGSNEPVESARCRLRLAMARLVRWES